MSNQSRLRYVDANEHGYRRLRKGPQFQFLDMRGKVIRNTTQLARIKSLVIPPAWTDVWICKDGRGHLQATGIDTRGRKQYLYHLKWRQLQEAAKFDKCLLFASQLPKIRRRVSALLRKNGLPRDKVLAVIVRLLDVTLIRVGNESYSKENGSFGLTTLRDRHVSVSKKKIIFSFKGKSGVEHELTLVDRRLARIVQRCQELPGQQLFQYRNEIGKIRDVKSNDVNQFLHEITNEEFTAKDFRTWAATQLAVEFLIKAGKASSRIEVERNICGVIKQVAHRLGNTVAVCRKSYIHPAVLDAYRNDSAHHWFSPQTNHQRKSKTGLSRIEHHVLNMLKKRRRTQRRAA